MSKWCRALGVKKFVGVRPRKAAYDKAYWADHERALDGIDGYTLFEGKVEDWQRKQPRRRDWSNVIYVSIDSGYYVSEWTPRARVIGNGLEFDHLPGKYLMLEGQGEYMAHYERKGWYWESQIRMKVNCRKEIYAHPNVVFPNSDKYFSCNGVRWVSFNSPANKPFSKKVRVYSNSYAFRRYATKTDDRRQIIAPYVNRTAAALKDYVAKRWTKLKEQDAMALYTQN